MSNNDVDAKAFFRQYAAEIAEALREQDDGPRVSSVEESVSELYRSLCFDEPIVDGTSSNFSVVVSALSRQILSTASPYALSDRLVNGVIYLSKRSTNPKTQNETAKSHDSIAIAKLAFCVFIQVPLRVCENINNITTVRKYLGSYKGSLSRATEVNNTKVSADDNPTNDTKVEQAVQQLSDGLSGAAISTPDGNAEDDSLKEVWAAESDPSDYDYGEGVPDYPQQSTFQFQEDDWLDPTRLSKPDQTLSLDQAQFAVGSLLKHASYNVLEPLFSLSNKEVASFTTDLSQLIFSLLQPKSPLATGEADMDASLQDAILSPLWVLRDAAIYSLSKKQQQQGLDSTYLDVLHTLLAVDQAHLQDLGGAASTSNATDLCTASIVGLSALSSWCGMAEISTQTTISSVIDAMNDISHVIERASDRYKNNLLHSVIPMLELLSGITVEKAKSIPTNSKIAQTLLNSGFLRQLLLVGLSGDLSATPNFHHALWGLSVAHPTTVGKYVARFPQTKDLIRHYLVTKDSTPKQCVASVLWNGFGWIHTDASAAQAPRVVWKTKAAQQKAAAPPLSKDECQEVCQKAWTQLCQLVESSLQEADKDLEAATETLDEWERLFSFVSVMSVSPSFHELLDDSLVQSVAMCLSSIPQVEKAEPEPTEEDAGTDPDDKRKKPKSTHHLVLSRARKVIKQYTLFFQGRGGSSKTD